MVDIDIGYRLRPNLNVARRVGQTPQTWILRTDSAGRRLTSVTRNDADTVVVVGDSMVFGEGVNDDETFASHLARAGFSVTNLGVPGYGSNQELLALRRYLQQHQRRTSWVIVVTSANDESDVRSSYQHMRHRPVARLTDGRLDLVPFNLPISDRISDMSSLIVAWRFIVGRKPITESGNGPAIVAACLEAMQWEARARGAHVLLVAQDSVRPEAMRAFIEAGEARGLELFDLSPALQTARQGGRRLLSYDGVHWNAEGHRVVAEELAGRMGR